LCFDVFVIQRFHRVELKSEFRVSIRGASIMGCTSFSGSLIMRFFRRDGCLGNSRLGCATSSVTTSLTSTTESSVMPFKSNMLDDLQLLDRRYLGGCGIANASARRRDLKLSEGLRLGEGNEVIGRGRFKSLPPPPRRPGMASFCLGCRDGSICCRPVGSRVLSWVRVRYGGI